MAERPPAIAATVFQTELSTFLGGSLGDGSGASGTRIWCRDWTGHQGRSALFNVNRARGRFHFPAPNYGFLGGAGGTDTGRPLPTLGGATGRVTNVGRPSPTLTVWLEGRCGVFNSSLLKPRPAP